MDDDERGAVEVNESELFWGRFNGVDLMRAMLHQLTSCDLDKHIFDLM